jgi:hypothetical protein
MNRLKSDHSTGLLEEAVVWDSAMSVSPSPRPSPLGRGGNIFRVVTIPEASCFPRGRERFSLSPGEGRGEGNPAVRPPAALKDSRNHQALRVLPQSQQHPKQSDERLTWNVC